MVRLRFCDFSMRFDHVLLRLDSCGLLQFASGDWKVPLGWKVSRAYYPNIFQQSNAIEHNQTQTNTMESQLNFNWTTIKSENWGNIQLCLTIKFQLVDCVLSGLISSIIDHFRLRSTGQETSVFDLMDGSVYQLF